MRNIIIRPSDQSLLLWLYKKSGSGFIFGNTYKIPLGYYGLKVPKDNTGSTIYPGNVGKVKRQSALYLVRLSPFETFGWGVGSLPCVGLDGEKTTVGVNGRFGFSIELPQLLYEKTVDIGDMVSLELFRERILSEVTNEIIISFEPLTIKQTNDVSRAIDNCCHSIAEIFSSFGLKLESFTVDGIV